MTDLEKDMVDAFLSELSELTRRHKITIDGCGCCTSPFLSSLEDDEDSAEYKYFVDEDNGYLSWDDHCPWL